MVSHSQETKNISDFVNIKNGKATNLKLNCLMKVEIENQKIYN